MRENEYKIPGSSSSFGKFGDFSKQSKKAVSATASYFKAHWLDYLLLFMICFVLGAFDVFILKRSDNFLKPEYWYHSATRMVAYVLAAVLGVRIGYPKAKAACSDLHKAMTKNRRLLPLKEIASTQFGDFIYKVNDEVKIGAWKHKINNKIKKLEKKAPNFFPLYYKDKSLKHFERYKRGIYKLTFGLAYKLKISKADSYCEKRATLEALLDEDYIKENIEALNVSYPRVNESDFNYIGVDGRAFKTYHTRANVKGSAASKIASSLIFTLISVLVLGSVALTFDEALASQRIVAIFSIIINTLVDIGFTIWKFLAGYLDCERIVRSEDLRSALDQNEILIRFKKTVAPEVLDEYEKERLAQEQEDKALQEEVANA